MCAVIWIVLIGLLVPTVFQRARIRMPKKNLIIAIFIMAYFLSGNFRDAQWHGRPIHFIIGAFFFTFFIGLDEDLFSRGLVFGLLEKYGIGVAAAIQAIHFGALHFTNYIWGGQSFSYTAAQMLDAAAFGYLCCGLMLLTGSIWVPILFHGLSDFPLQMQTQHDFTVQVTGAPDWGGTILDAAMMASVAAVLIGMKSPWAIERSKKVLSHFGLVE